MKIFLIVLTILGFYFFDFNKLIYKAKSSYYQYIVSIKNLKRSSMSINNLEGKMLNIQKNGFILIFNVLLISFPYLLVLLILISTGMNRVFSSILAIIPYSILLIKKR